MAPPSSTHFMLLVLSLLLLTATTYVQVSAENQHLQLLQDVTYPPPQAPAAIKPPAPPVTKPLTPPAKSSAPTPPAVTKPPTPSVKPYTPAPPAVTKPPTPPVKPYTPAPPVVTPAPPVATPPTPYRPPVKKEECGTLCLGRCKLHSRPGLCMRACSTCCVRCRCVPPGTYGNRELCGKCYTDMRTHGNRFKCP